VTDQDEEEYVPRRDRGLLVRFVVLFVLGLVCVAVGFDFLAGFRVGRYIAAGFGTVTEPGTTSQPDAGIPRDAEDFPQAPAVE
jgi:hypothetical protein